MAEMSLKQHPVVAAAHSTSLMAVDIRQLENRNGH
jgi:hypothetical protein